MEVQSLLVAEVLGGAKVKAQKATLKNVSHLWQEVSVKHTASESVFKILSERLWDKKNYRSVCDSFDKSKSLVYILIFLNPQFGSVHGPNYLL